MGVVRYHKAKTSRGQKYTKFDVSSCGCCRDNTGGVKFSNMSCDPDHAHLGRSLVISRLWLASVNLQTKFEVSNYSHCEDMKSGAKCTNWGSLGQLGVIQSHWQCHCSTSYSTLIETMRLSCTVLEIQPVICQKSPMLTHPTCIWRPHRGWTRSNIVKIFGIRKLESLGYCVGGVVCVILRWAVLVKLRLVTDRQTDTGP